MTEYCDRCRVASAIATAHKEGLELSFCGHHLSDYVARLTVDGWELRPTEDAGTLNSSASSDAWYKRTSFA